MGATHLTLDKLIVVVNWVEWVSSLSSASEGGSLFERVLDTWGSLPLSSEDRAEDGAITLIHTVRVERRGALMGKMTIPTPFMGTQAKREGRCFSTPHCDTTTNWEKSICQQLPPPPPRIRKGRRRRDPLLSLLEKRGRSRTPFKRAREEGKVCWPCDGLAGTNAFLDFALPSPSHFFKWALRLNPMLFFYCPDRPRPNQSVGLSAPHPRPRKTRRIYQRGGMRLRKNTILTWVLDHAPRPAKKASLPCTTILRRVCFKRAPSNNKRGGKKGRGGGGVVLLCHEDRGGALALRAE